ncbi:MAG: ferredoxin [Candidatus Pacearchaeota archaeon]
MAKIIVDREKCIGCGACAAVCPGTFEMFEGKARVKKAEVKKITCEKDAAEGCPVGAISIK